MICRIVCADERAAPIGPGCDVAADGDPDCFVAKVFTGIDMGFDTPLLGVEPDTLWLRRGVQCWPQWAMRADWMPRGSRHLNGARACERGAAAVVHRSVNQGAVCGRNVAAPARSIDCQRATEQAH